MNNSGSQLQGRPGTISVLPADRDNDSHSVQSGSRSTPTASQANAGNQQARPASEIYASGKAEVVKKDIKNKERLELYKPGFNNMSDQFTQEVTVGNTKRQLPPAYTKVYNSPFVISDPTYPDYKINLIAFAPNYGYTVVLAKTKPSSATMHIFNKDKKLEFSFELNGENVEPLGLQCIEMEKENISSDDPKDKQELQILYYFKDTSNIQKPKIILQYLLPAARKYKSLINSSALFGTPILLDFSPKHLKVRKSSKGNEACNYVDFLFLTDRTKFMYAKFKASNIDWFNQIKTLGITYIDNSSKEGTTRSFVDFNFDSSYETSNDNLFAVLENEVTRYSGEERVISRDTIFICRINYQADDLLNSINKIIKLDDKIDIYRNPKNKVIQLNKTEISVFSSVHYCSAENKMTVVGMTSKIISSDDIIWNSEIDCRIMSQEGKNWNMCEVFKSAIKREIFEDWKTNKRGKNEKCSPQNQSNL